jgi:hypothetical protein
MQDHIEMVAGLARSLEGDSSELARPVECSQKCGQQYCSETCRDDHFLRKGHRLLCVGLISDAEAKSHPLMKFKMHALQTNEIFLLVADVVCKILISFLATNSKELALAPFRDFKQELWWECCAVPDDVVDGKKFLASLQTLCQKSSKLLSAAISHPAELNFLFTRDFFGHVIGMFEQNNVGVRLASPLYSYVLKCLRKENGVNGERFLRRNRVLIREIVRAFEEQGDHESECNSEGEEGDEGEEPGQAQEVKEEATEHEDEQTMDRRIVESLQPPIVEQRRDEFVPTLVNEVFTPLDGTALFTWICMMNHSCEPNCWVQYRGGQRSPLLCEVVALRDIAAGEELFQSYIDKHLAVDARQAALCDYGFVCRCVRCVREAT